MPELTDRPITRAQVRAIHVAIARQGIDDADYRAHLRAGWAVRTSKALTRRQASQLLHELQVPMPATARKEPPPRRRSRRPADGGALRMVSPEQRALIEALAAEIAWREPDGYRRWLRRNMSLERVASAAQAARVIQGLLAMRRRGRRLIGDV